jgi:hypothetical protein
MIACTEDMMSSPLSTAPAPRTPAWEFTSEQNLLVARLASRMRYVGTALMVLAAMLAAWALLGSGSGDMLALQVGIVLALTGLWSARGGAAFARVVKTQGLDVQHVMRALHHMAKLYELQYWVFLAAALLLAVTILMAITGASWLPEIW